MTFLKNRMRVGVFYGSQFIFLVSLADRCFSAIIIYNHNTHSHTHIHTHMQTLPVFTWFNNYHNTDTALATYRIHAIIYMGFHICVFVCAHQIQFQAIFFIFTVDLMLFFPIAFSSFFFSHSIRIELTTPVPR